MTINNHLFRRPIMTPSPWHRLILCLLVILALIPANIRAAASAPSQKQSLVAQLKDYPADLRCEDLDVATLLRAIGRQAGMTIYVSEAIDSTITFEMANANLYEVFQLIIGAKGLHYREQGNSIMVETMAEYSQTGKDIISISVCPDYGNGGELKSQLDALLSKQGSITVTKHDSCLIIKDHEKKVRRIQEVLQDIDQPIPQVHIEARIVMLAQEAKEALGIKWGYQNYGSDAILATKNKTVKAVSDLGLDALNPPATLGVGMIWDTMKLDAELHAMATDDLLHILSAPSIMVLDGMEAEIKQGKEVPYASSSQYTSTTQFREATLSLKVRPKIIRDNFISMTVDVTNDKVDQNSSVEGQPLIDRQSIKTNLFLDNRATVVIGGIHVSSDDINKGRVPGLAAIPLLGELFKNRGSIEQNYELMIFITPTIVSMDLHKQASARQQQAIDTVLSDKVHKKLTPAVYAMPGQEIKKEPAPDQVNINTATESAVTDRRQ